MTSVFLRLFLATSSTCKRDANVCACGHHYRKTLEQSSEEAKCEAWTPSLDANPKFQPRHTRWSTSPHIDSSATKSLSIKCEQSIVPSNDPTALGKLFPLAACLIFWISSKLKVSHVHLSLHRNNMSPIVEKSNTKISFKELTELVQPEGVQELVLTNVQITGDEDEEFFFGRAIRGHPSMQKITLTNITLDEGMTLDNIVEMVLISCHELTSLKLDKVPVRAKSCGTLVYCQTLQHLALPNNGFNDVDAKLIADSVESNESVTSVDLSGNCISDVGCKSLRNCLEKNQVIQKIVLDGNSVSGAETAKLDSKLQTRIAMAA